MEMGTCLRQYDIYTWERGYDMLYACTIALVLLVNMVVGIYERITTDNRAVNTLPVATCRCCNKFKHERLLYHIYEEEEVCLVMRCCMT